MILKSSGHIVSTPQPELTANAYSWIHHLFAFHPALLNLCSDFFLDLPFLGNSCFKLSVIVYIKRLQKYCTR